VLTSRIVLGWLLAALPDSCIVSTCGYVTRELYDVGDRPGNFYLVGSMGMAGPIAYGIAAVQSHRRLVAVDGDGSVVMNLGGLTLAAQTRADLVHVVLDNGMHESTGGQDTSLPADLTAVARAAGYQRAVSVESEADLAVLDDLERWHGPQFVHARVEPRNQAIGRRVQETPQELVTRFRKFLDIR
jgi:sulfopyruvate decarboxylase subunit beta